MKTKKTAVETPASLLLDLIENRLGERPKSALAEHMGVRPQSLYKWLACARADSAFMLPPVRARQVAEFFRVAPSRLRPDVFLPR